MTRVRKLWPLALALIGIAGFVYAGWKVMSKPPAPEDDEYVDVAPPPAAPGERFEVVRTHELTETRGYKGNVSGEGLIEIRAPKGMLVPIVKIHHEHGDFVKKGDPLITLDRKQVEDAIVEAREAGRDADVLRFEGYLEHVVLRAPVDGQVHDIKLDTGNIPIEVGIPLMTLADRSSYVFVALVPNEVAVKSANLGREVLIHLDAGIGDVRGTVTAHDATGERNLDVPGGYMAVVASLPPTPGVEQDLAGELRLAAAVKKVGLVPQRAVTWRGDTGVVRVAEDGEVLERTIQHGAKVGDDIIVLYGVFPGESVLVPDVD